MTETDFRATLPTFTPCGSCGVLLKGLQWNVIPDLQGEWAAVAIIKCEACNVAKMAAAGSTDAAHAFAQAIRMKFMKSIGK